MTKIEVDNDPFYQKLAKALVHNCIMQNTSLAALLSEEDLIKVRNECVSNVFTAMHYSMSLRDPLDYPDGKLNPHLLRQEAVSLASPPRDPALNKLPKRRKLGMKM